VTVGRLEPDLEKLGELYWQGYNDALSQMEELKKYLNV
jgi:predicted patatin/cPLA2 family phospholipase